jgi:hypothetical protein
MEQERARERPEDERQAEAPPAETPAKVEAPFRCPFCHAGMQVGDLAAHCDACKAPHHLACFAERSGCAATGCAGQTATSRKLALPPRVACPLCDVTLTDDDWVARCACGTLSHPPCFEAKKGCGKPHCSGHGRIATLHTLKLEGQRANATILPLLTGIMTLGAGLGLLAATIEYFARAARAASSNSYYSASYTQEPLIAGLIALGCVLVFGFFTLLAIRHVRNLPKAPPPILRPRRDPKQEG